VTSPTAFNLDPITQRVNYCDIAQALPRPPNLGTCYLPWARLTWNTWVHRKGRRRNRIASRRFQFHCKSVSTRTRESWQPGWCTSNSSIYIGISILCIRWWFNMHSLCTICRRKTYNLFLIRGYKLSELYNKRIPSCNQKPSTNPYPRARRCRTWSWTKSARSLTDSGCDDRAIRLVNWATILLQRKSDMTRRRCESLKMRGFLWRMQNTEFQVAWMIILWSLKTLVIWARLLLNFISFAPRGSDHEIPRSMSTDHLYFLLNRRGGPLQDENRETAEKSTNRHNTCWL